MTPHDLCDDSDAIKARKVTFVLSPKQWKSFSSSSKLTSSWTVVPLAKSSRMGVPKKSGVYSLILDPCVACHPYNGYLMYVGQTLNLHRRMGEYLGVEKNKVKRPRVSKLLNVYAGYLRFVFIEVAATDLDSVEDDFLGAHIPPCCDEDELPAAIRKAAKAAF